MIDVESLRLRLRADLTEAMRFGERTRTRVVRGLLSTFDNAEAVPTTAGSAGVVFGTAEVPRGRLTGTDAGTILDEEMTERRAALAEYERLEQHDAAAELRAELEIVAGYRSEFVRG